jgi:chromatin segregation and condensation protein Rec8/ScpA/Scc1 (kleisin family)
MAVDYIHYAAKLKTQKLSGLGEGPGEEDEEGRSGNYLEQLKRKRDYRRRRQTYRAKNVHITRKTPREVSDSESA